jgi:ketosteroid isomerase-like protein
LLGSRGVAGDGNEAVSQFIDTYFQTWSRQDMEGYRNCFHPEAVIYFIDANGVPQGTALERFIDGQRLVHAGSGAPMREIPLSKSIEIDGNVARALVRWKLFNDGGEEVGTDYFSLVKTKTGWRIVSLMFRKDG